MPTLDEHEALQGDLADLQQRLDRARTALGLLDGCEQSGDPRVWRATPKKLAMTESDTVRSNARLRAQRMLPVDRGVAPSGETEMLAHIKRAATFARSSAGRTPSGRIDTGPRHSPRDFLPPRS